MTADDHWRVATSGLAYRYAVQETRHWAFAEVVSNVLIDGLVNRSILHFSNTDNGRTGWYDYGPSDLAVGSRVELFEFRVYDEWLADFCVLKGV